MDYIHMLRKPYSKFITIDQYNKILVSQGKNTITVDTLFENECKRVFETASLNRNQSKFIKASFPCVPVHIVDSAMKPDLVIHGIERYELKYNTKNVTALVNFVNYNIDGVVHTLNKGKQSCLNVVQNRQGVEKCLQRVAANKYGVDFPTHFVNQ